MDKLIRKICDKLFPNLQTQKIFDKMTQGSTPNMSPEDYVLQFVNICDDMSSLSYEYSKLAAHVLHLGQLDSIIKLNVDTFSKKIHYIDTSLSNFLNKQVVNYIQENADKLDMLVGSINPLPEYLDLFGYKTN